MNSQGRDLGRPGSSGGQRFRRPGNSCGPEARAARRYDRTVHGRPDESKLVSVPNINLSIGRERKLIVATGRLRQHAFFQVKGRLAELAIVSLATISLLVYARRAILSSALDQGV